MRLYIHLVALLALFTSLSSALAQNFGLAATLPTGNNPNSVVAADVNGDGKADLISANFGSDTITIWTNNGTGGFGSNTAVSVIAQPWSMTAADVNGDGYADVVLAGRTGYLLVLTNNEHGSLVLNDPLPYLSTLVIAADINGDGKQDLICGFQIRDSNSLLILTNSGGGVFGSNATYQVNFNLSELGPAFVAADVNGDGKLDLILANGGANSITILTNDGSGIFVSNATYMVGNFAQCVRAADVNGDGKLDLICVNHNDNTLTILTNGGGGIFASNATYSAGTGAFMVTASDVNGDGKVDLITANLNSGSESFTVFTNDGSGKFVAAPLPGPINSPWCVVADISGNGKPALIGAMTGANELAVYTNFYAFPAPTSHPPVTIKSSFSSTAVRVAWPAGSGGWSLQQSPSLTGPNWLPAGYHGHPVENDGVNQSLIVSPPSGNQFFRLFHP